MDDFTIAYVGKHLFHWTVIDVHASNGTVAAAWSWRIMNDADQEAFFETIIYPAIREFVASWSAQKI